MNYAEAIEYIHRTQWRGSKPGLSRTEKLLGMLGNPQRRLRFVHVAGTNGKGSTCAILESVLRTAGYKTGLFVSPFVVRFNERIQVGGSYISDEQLSDIIGRIAPFADSMEDAPTEFELITAAAMLFFAEQGCEIVVLEVGMGGELDSTNVIDTPLAAVITSIGLDHTRELGDTSAQIAAAKAGIIKQGGDVVVYGGEDAVMQVFRSACLARNAALHPAELGAVGNVRLSLDGLVFDFGEERDIFLPLVGAYQPYNAAVVMEVIRLLRGKGFAVSARQVREGFRAVSWPGRMEVLRRDPVFILDGSHNNAGLGATVESLKALFPEKKTVFIAGMMADKDVDSAVRLISPLAARVYTVRPDNARAMDAEKLAAAFTAAGAAAEPCGDIDTAVCKAVRLAGRDTPVCAIGTLYFSADVRRAVGLLKI